MRPHVIKDTSPTIAIETHGCKLNQADSGAIADRFLRQGYRLVSDAEAADVYVVNSCTVTHIADRKARQSLRSARRRNPDAIIVAAGCYAQRSPATLESLPEIDLVAGTADNFDVASMVAERMGETAEPRAAFEGPAQVISRTRAMVKIQEGCDQVCAFCIVPRVRGRERSVPPDDIIGLIDAHVSSGYREVVLTGTQLGTYGFDLPGIDLGGLLSRVLSETGIARLRVSSLQPQEIKPELLALWADPRLCPHLHIPLQSGSDAVLKRMRRRYTSARYQETVTMVRDAVPGVSITTDVIVGFPGESEADFQDTYALCDRTGFAAMHVFPYSVRPGTSAAHFEDSLDTDAKSRRMARLLALSRRHALAFRARFLGATRPVLWEARMAATGEERWSGLTDNYIRVVGFSARPLANEITPALLVAQKEDLVLAQVLH